MATGRNTKRAKKLSNVFDHFSKKEIDNMTAEKKDQKDNTSEKDQSQTSEIPCCSLRMFSHVFLMSSRCDTWMPASPPSSAP